MNDPHRGESNIVIGEHRLIYMPTLKGACSSIKAALKSSFPRQSMLIRDNSECAEIIAGRGDPRTRSELVPEVDTWLVAAFTRHPLDRLLSMWNHLTQREDFYGPLRTYGMYAWMPFEEAVDIVASVPDAEADAHFRQQAVMFATPSQEMLPNWYGRFERLSEDWGLFRGLMGARGLVLPETLPHINRRDHRHWRTYYDARMMSVAEARYADDLQMFYNDSGADWEFDCG